jgi:arylsulfatase
MRNIAVLLLWGALLTGCESTEPSERPNFILILSDDMGFSDIGAYGSEIETPNIDRLATGGARFTQFYNAGRCCPSRASLLTGLYPHQAGIGHMNADHGYLSYRGELSLQAVTIAEVLKPAGYHNLMAGKWHVSHPNLDEKHNWPLQRGFDRFYGSLHGGGGYYNPKALIHDNTPIQVDENDYHYTDAITDYAIQFLEEHRGQSQPFFLYVAYTAPHWPLHARPEDIAKYKGRYLDGWDEIRTERLQRLVEMGVIDDAWALTERDAEVPPWTDALNKEWEDHRMAVYAAQIDQMDRGIGRILSKVRELDAEENTLVLFLADNGGCAELMTPETRITVIPRQTLDGRPVRLGNLPDILPGPEDTHQSYGIGWANASNTPFRLYKHWVHEGGTATPLIAYWPRRIKNINRLVHEPGHVIDLMATIADASGAPYPSRYNEREITPLEGKSLIPLLEGSDMETHQVIYWEHEGNRAVRKGDWKLVSRYPGDWELYNMKDDRTETRDLAAEHPSVVQELAALYDRWAERTGVIPWAEVNSLSQ